MDMTKTSKLLGAIGMALAALAGTANAQLIVLETHETQCVVADTTLTPWTFECNVPLYNPANHGGSLLEEVMVTLEGTATSNVDVTATNDVILNPSTGLPPGVDANGSAGATVTSNWTVGGQSLTLSAFPTSDVVSTQDIPLAGGNTAALADLFGTDSTMATTTGTANTAIYLGTGDFQVGLSGTGFGQPPFSAGGNVGFEQVTDAGARFTVQYKTAEVLPEPSAGLMALFGCIGLLGIRRGRRK